MEKLQNFVVTFQEYLWSYPMLILLVGTHLYFTVRLGVIQRKIPQGIRLSMSKEAENKESISAYSSLATSLAATIGTGNIVGISTAIAIGGAGAVFWCWITGFLGIATCYAESFLAVRYKVHGSGGETYGGPMYVLERRLGKKSLAAAFAVFTVLASFGIGSSVQSYSIRMAVEQHAAVSPHVIGIVTGVLAGLVIVGGSRQIADVCTWLVPVMSVFYMGGCIWIIVQNIAVVPEALRVICCAAFRGDALAGGLAGSTVMAGMRAGISRGLFTNEAGLGSIPMVAAASGIENPVQQGLISMTGPFWDTVVMCAVTGIASVSSMLCFPERYAGIPAEKMCFAAFAQLPFGGEAILSVALALFAFATIIGWNVYGVSAVRYLCGENGIKAYQVCYMFCVYLGAVLSMDLLWGMSDLFNSFMAVPNLISLFLLRREIIAGTRNQNESYPAGR